MKPQTIDVSPANEWLTTEEAARLLGRAPRTVQKMAKEGLLAWKPAGNSKQPHQRLYDAADVTRIAGGAPRPPANRELALRKPPPSERNLDMVSILGNLAAGHKGEIEALIAQSTHQVELLIAQSARQLETVVTLILGHQKAEADANRERLNAERADARERWELERRDRAAKLKRQARAAKTPKTPAERAAAGRGRQALKRPRGRQAAR